MSTGAARASHPLFVEEPGVVAAETFFFCDFCERLVTGVQQREEWAVISASLCANLFGAVLDRTDWEHLVLLQHHHVIASICVVCRF